MGVQLDVWRARIGCFTQPVKVKMKMRTLVVNGRILSVALRTLVFVSILVCGDVEANPGPPKQAHGHAGRQTRQTSLYFSQPDNSANRDNNERRYSDIAAGSSQTQDDMFAFLRNMKKELDGQNDKVRRDLASMAEKIDSITTSINNLKMENEQLKQSNVELKEEMKNLETKIDTLESHSRRTNLRINGIDGSPNESWEETEMKVRDFISNDLDLPDKRDVDIERAHRIHNDRNTIIVKFTRYKDSQSIFQKATETLNRQSRLSVQQDYTERVKRHRRELGKKMISARENGQYASIRYDKLLIDNKVYRYNEVSGEIVCVGNRLRKARDNQSHDQADTLATRVRNEDGRVVEAGAGTQADEAGDVTS